MVWPRAAYDLGQSCPEVFAFGEINREELKLPSFAQVVFPFCVRHLIDVVQVGLSKLG